MEVGMSLNQLVRLPLSSHGRMHDDSVIKHSLFSTTSRRGQKPKHHNRLMVVEAKGKKGMAARQYQRKPPPPLPKLEDDGNPKFVVFIRMANVTPPSLSVALFSILRIIWKIESRFHLLSVNFQLRYAAVFVVCRFTFGTLLILWQVEQLRKSWLLQRIIFLANIFTKILLLGILQLSFIKWVSYSPLAYAIFLSLDSCFEPGLTWI